MYRQLVTRGEIGELVEGLSQNLSRPKRSKTWKVLVGIYTSMITNNFREVYISDGDAVAVGNAGVIIEESKQRLEDGKRIMKDYEELKNYRKLSGQTV